MLSPSVIRSNPPPEVPIIVLAPAKLEPRAMFTTEISLSAWNAMKLCSSCFFASSCNAFVAGVIG